MRAQRIKTGFHRIGVVLVVLAVLLALVRIWGGGADDTSVRQGLAIAACGAILFGLAIAIGWIVAGFAGGGEHNSN